MATTLLSAEQCLWCTSAIAFRCIADLDVCLFTVYRDYFSDDVLRRIAAQIERVCHGDPKLRM